MVGTPFRFLFNGRPTQAKTMVSLTYLGDALLVPFLDNLATVCLPHTNSGQVMLLSLSLCVYVCVCMCVRMYVSPLVGRCVSTRGLVLSGYNRVVFLTEPPQVQYRPKRGSNSVVCRKTNAIVAASFVVSTEISFVFRCPLRVAIGIVCIGLLDPLGHTHVQRDGRAVVAVRTPSWRQTLLILLRDGVCLFVGNPWHYNVE